jgi:protein TonB
MKHTSTVPHPGGGQSATRQKPNWLLRVLIIGSIGLHGILLFYLATIYRSQNMSVIELSLRDESAPVQRAIPRPKPPPRHSPQPPDKITPIRTRPVPPDIKPIQMADVNADLPKGITEAISDTLGAQAPSARVEAWEPVVVPDFSLETFDSPASYLEMVRFRIEKNKQYPEKARLANMRGSVIVSLVITLQGRIESIVVKKSSGFPILDEAALAAVKNAMPFPVPPARFFKKDILLNIPILFEIT